MFLSSSDLSIANRPACRTGEGFRATSDIFVQLEQRPFETARMLCPLLLLVLVLPCSSAGGSVSVNIKDLGAIEGIQSLDVRGAKRLVLLHGAASKQYISTEYELQFDVRTASTFRTSKSPAVPLRRELPA